MMTPTSQLSDYLNHIFDELLNYKYLVLRNYENLPGQPGNDIDLLVDPAEADIVAQTLIDVSVKHGWQLVLRVERFAFRSLTFVRADDQIPALQWDLAYPITWKGISWIDSNFILDNVLWHREKIPVPPAGVEAAILCLKDLLQIGSIRDKYKQRIYELTNRDPDKFKQSLLPIFRENTISWLIDQITLKQWSTIEAKVHNLQWELVTKQFSHNPLNTLVAIGRFMILHLKNYLNPGAGYFLCLIGPDGSGKSTVSAQITRVFRHTKYYHGRFGILPDIGALIGRKSADDFSDNLAGNGYNVHPKPGWIKKVIYMSYYGFDNLLGHFLIRRHFGKGNVVIFDRYYYDYVIQPNFVKPNNFLFRFWNALIAKPNKIFYLKSPAELVHQRKPELPISEIRRQDLVCMQLSEKLANFQIVDNSHGIDQSVQTVISAIALDLNQQ